MVYGWEGRTVVRIGYYARILATFAGGGFSWTLREGLLPLLLSPRLFILPQRAVEILSSEACLKK